MMNIVELSGVGKSYPSPGQDLVILDQLNFSLAEGELVSITGDSGSGKSTLLNLIAGLDSPTSGQVQSCGYQVDQLTEAGLTEYRSRRLGLVFQFHFLLKEFTALENVFLPGWMAGQDRSAAEAKARELLAAVGLADRMGHYPGQLSGGERQRASLARALINDPSLILADEPTGNLDENNSATVKELLFDLVRRYGKSLILVTHDRELAGRADRHYHLQHGRLVQQ